jgi:hypothetical protein
MVSVARALDRDGGSFRWAERTAVFFVQMASLALTASARLCKQKRFVAAVRPVRRRGIEMRSSTINIFDASTAMLGHASVQCVCWPSTLAGKRVVRARGRIG